MKLESSDARKSAALATSRGWLIRPIGISDTNRPLTSLGTPTKTPISRHDCVEGWSCIGKWKGIPLSALLDSVKLKPDARYIVFYCADNLFETGKEKDKYYESIGLVDAYHPQTILAYEMNDQTLPIANGAPLRLRVERQLGYKMAKYVMRIEAVDHIVGIRGGRGGFWEDLGYEWYAGI